MIALIRIFVFMTIWIVLGQMITHFFYPEMWDNESTRTALPWLLFIGYAVGTLGMGVSNIVGELFKRD